TSPNAHPEHETSSLPTVYAYPLFFRRLLPEPQHSTTAPAVAPQLVRPTVAAPQSCFPFQASCP
ncbi:hypothetical protein, partial [Nocardia gipuzkoensis]|uniref:hypothetical protein n=1 Tax=Nocardia gipuzkoensis TaxID=2749991 RepID=UPI00237EB82B